MGEYEKTLADIRNTFGILPKFMTELPHEELVEDWNYWKADSSRNAAR